MLVEVIRAPATTSMLTRMAMPSQMLANQVRPAFSLMLLHRLAWRCLPSSRFKSSNLPDERTSSSALLVSAKLTSLAHEQP